ncbi:MAG: ApbE family lipoprotein, partial [Deltaproteobacteria bacterium]|nr:ApbE family lipoprotein [Deltaproteobacteria bacterium]
TRLAMGTFVSMTLMHPSKDQAEESMEAAFSEIDRLSRLLSRYDHASAVYDLNTQGHLKDLGPELTQVVASSLYYHQLTGGCFDVTVKPVVDLFQEKLGGEKKIWPTEAEIIELLGLVDSRKIELKEKSLSFRTPGMGITLDGIAKGFIVDCASEVLSSRGIRNHLINAGGDIRTRGSKEDGKPWTVAIQDPWKRKTYPDVVQIGDGCIATSGNYEVFYDQEKMFHHIVNPKTGFSPDLTTSVSIRANTTMEADALATSVCIMTPSQGTEFVNGLSACESLVIGKDGALWKSKGWKSAAI